MKQSIHISASILIVTGLLIILVKCSNNYRDENSTNITTDTDIAKGSTQIGLNIGSSNSGPVPAENKSYHWKADAAHAQITFRVNGPFGTVRGGLSDLRSTIEFNESDLAHSSIVASVAPKTINTGNKTRDSDLQKENYLASDQYPMISFRSQQFQKAGNGYIVSGTLSIKKTSRMVSIPFTFDHKGNSGNFKGQFIIQRTDYDVGKSGGLLKIGKEITINLEVPVSKG